MIPTKIYEFTLAANASQRLLVAGEFFKVLSASGSLRITADWGTIEPVGTGQGLEKTPFNYLYFTDLSGGANTVRVVIGDENFIDSSVGTVAVTATVVPRSSAFAQSAANVTNVSATLIAANANRQYFLIQNNDAAGIVYVNLAGAAATAANGLQVPPGGVLECGNVITVGAITAIGSIAANPNVVIVEG